jgi:hypothetical protein
MRRIKKLTIVIEDYDEPDGSDVSMSIHGETIGERFSHDDVQVWNRIGNPIHAIIAEMGDLGPGRKVSITSEP